MTAKKLGRDLAKVRNWCPEVKFALKEEGKSFFVQFLNVWTINIFEYWQLETFKRQLMQSLSDDNSSVRLMSTNFRQIP